MQDVKGKFTDMGHFPADKTGGNLSKASQFKPIRNEPDSKWRLRQADFEVHH
jgi:hypothetical protein